VAYQTNHHLVKSHDRLNAAEHIIGGEREKRNMKRILTNYINAASVETIIHVHFCFFKNELKMDSKHASQIQTTFHVLAEM
jgi:hypothetical protein